jgi:hypothetical protein
MIFGADFTRWCGRRRFEGDAAEHQRAKRLHLHVDATALQLH